MTRRQTEKVLTDIDSAPKYAQSLFVSCLEATDPLWDEETALIESPRDRSHVIRASTWYALGLLVRDAAGDRTRAAATIDAVLDHQFTDDPEAVYYGTWARNRAEFHPMENPTEWADYDPNWREFVGSALTVIHDYFGEMLPATLRDQIATAIRTAVAGTRRRTVSPGYTNIALMRAFLLQWGADRFEDDDLGRVAATYARKIHDLFRPHETFCEFNSPTYTGVSLDALSLWVTNQCSGPLNELGKEMEAALWHQLSEFYHGDLGLLCGPYARAYGMDTHNTTTAYYVWLATGGNTRRPFPESHHTSIPGNYCAALLSVVLTGWSRVPGDAVDSFHSFSGERHVTRTIDCKDQRGIATAWLGDDVMIGGFAVESGSNVPRSDQFHGATLHWQVDDSIGWGRVVPMTDCWPDVRADSGVLHVEGERGVPLTFELQVPGIEAETLEWDRWCLPGLTVDVDATAADVHIESIDKNVLRVQFVPVNEHLEVSLHVRTSE